MGRTRRLTGNSLYFRRFYISNRALLYQSIPLTNFRASICQAIQRRGLPTGWLPLSQRDIFAIDDRNKQTFPTSPIKGSLGILDFLIGSEEQLTRGTEVQDLLPSNLHVKKASLDRRGKRSFLPPGMGRRCVGCDLQLGLIPPPPQAPDPTDYYSLLQLYFSIVSLLYNTVTSFAVTLSSAPRWSTVGINAAIPRPITEFNKSDSYTERSKRKADNLFDLGASSPPQLNHPFRHVMT